VLMPISFDHMQHLGDTLAKIAFEKAGIMRAGVPAIVARQPAEAMAVFEARAGELGAALHRQDREWQVGPAGAGLRFRDAAGERLLPQPGLPGRHQIDNAGAALACLPFLGPLGIDEAAQAQGLAAVDWPARLQRLKRGPLIDRLPSGWELWLDGGHNQAAGEMLAGFAEGWGDRPLHLIFGMLTSKDPIAFLAPLAARARALQAVAIGGHASLAAEDAAAAARAAGLPAETAESVDAALARILATEPGPARILICGSLYLAGVVLAENG